MNLKLDSNYEINTFAGAKSYGLAIGYARTTIIDNISIEINEKSINFEQNGVYKNSVNFGTLVGNINNCKITNCKSKLEDSEMILTNNSEKGKYAYFIGGMVGRTERSTNIIDHSTVTFIESSMRI